MTDKELRIKAIKDCLLTIKDLSKYYKPAYPG